MYLLRRRSSDLDKSWNLTFSRPVDSRRFLSKTHILDRRFWTFSAWIWAKWVRAPIYSKRHLEQDNMYFLPLASRFMTFLLGQAQKSEFRDFWVRKWPTSLGFSFFGLSFFSFLIFSLQWLTFYWACFKSKNSRSFPRKHHREHFCTYFRLHWPNHSDLGIIGKIFSSCRSWA